MARKSFLAILVGATALAVPSAFADKGGIPHDGSNGQGRAAAQTQVEANAQGKALAKGHARTHAKAQAKGLAKTHVQRGASTHGKALAKGHAKTQANVQPQAKVNTHAQAGKTTFCHATGSATNPYVTITTSNNALPAHTRHQDGRDIIPAPEGGCPGATTEQNTPGLPSTEQKLGKTTICHATGSATNPFVMITISDNALAAHTAHQDGRDVIPASGGTCPGATESSNTLPGTPETPSGTTPASGTQGQVGVMGESTTSPGGSNGSNGSNATPNNVNVLGESTGSAPSASSSPAATGTRASSSNGLPFTGTDAIIVALLGLAALLLGVTVRRATTNRA
jgi:hypothetical protein